MRKSRFKLITFFLLLLLLFASSSLENINTQWGKNNSTPLLNQKFSKIKGVNLVSKKQYSSEDFVYPVKDTNADWIALTPFAFMNPDDPKIYFPTVDNYWGDHPDNIRYTAKLARKNNLKIMLKPHTIVGEHGWAGDYDLNFWQWRVWEKNFEKFTLDMAQLAEELDIEIFCIGVEFKIAVQKRNAFWRNLISKIRKVYKGKLTYASNWDEYQDIHFWYLLDYIGIDGYFPLSEEKTPKKALLVKAWKPISEQLYALFKKTKRQIIFTEYGYRSTDFACGKQWEIEKLGNDQLVNHTSQINGYAAFYESIWNQKWCAGGFVWKWHPENNVGGLNNSNYTPQGKPSLQLIKKYYGQQISEE